MSEFSKLYDEEFFIIDSNNLNLLNPKLYGFSILDYNIVKNDNIDCDVNLSGLGSYIQIKEVDEKIFIYQDFNGSWGLYLYDTGDYFAISNSFLKLVEYLKNNQPLSVNEEYAKSLISTNGSTLIFRQTLVNEICVIPRNQFIIIDKNTKQIFLEKIDYKYHSVSLDSYEALDILDNWFFRWIKILRSIKKDTNNIEFDLSGGLETKIILMFALFSNINLNQIYFKVDEPNDEIKSLAEEFGFKLNNNAFSVEKFSYEDIGTILNLAAYVKLGFHNQLDYMFFRTSEPIYHFSGSILEMVGMDKFHKNKSFDQIFNYHINCARDVDESFMLAFKKELDLSFNDLMLEFDFSSENPKELFYLNFNEVISCNHFGKYGVSEFFTNKFYISPFLDPELHKIKLTTDKCSNQYLLYVVILIRYFPSLFKLIKDNFNISYNLVKYAIEINLINPFVSRDFNYISCSDLIENNGTSYCKFSIKDIKICFKEAFRSPGFKKDFKRFFSEDFYWKLWNLVENDEKNSFEKLSSVFQVLKIVDDIDNNNCFKFNEWILNLIERNHFHEVNDVLKLENKLNSKAHIYHGHEFLSKDQLENVCHMLKNNRIYKNIGFSIENKFIDENVPIKISNLNILDFEDNIIEIDFDELYLIYDNKLTIPFKNISFITSDGSNNYYCAPTMSLESGEHELCIRYKDTYSEDKSFFIKNEYNLFNVDEWLSLNIHNFDKFNVESISCSFDWADIGDKSVKVVCNYEGEYQALVTRKQDVDVGDLISVYVTVFNPHEEVIVRLFESSVASYTDVSVPSSNIPKRINIVRKALTNNVQLLLISRVKQTFYADNFVFTVI